VAEFLPNVGAYEPVVEVVVQDNVNRQRLPSLELREATKIGRGGIVNSAVTSVNFGAPLKKSGKLTAVNGCPLLARHDGA
jgi:hypothetical protein